MLKSSVKYEFISADWFSPGRTNFALDEYNDYGPCSWSGEQGQAALASLNRWWWLWGPSVEYLYNYAWELRLHLYRSSVSASSISIDLFWKGSDPDSEQRLRGLQAPGHGPQRVPPTGLCPGLSDRKGGLPPQLGSLSRHSRCLGWWWRHLKTIGDAFHQVALHDDRRGRPAHIVIVADQFGESRGQRHQYAGPSLQTQTGREMKMRREL